MRLPVDRSLSTATGLEQTRIRLGSDLSRFWRQSTLNMSSGLVSPTDEAREPARLRPSPAPSGNRAGNRIRMCPVRAACSTDEGVPTPLVAERAGFEPAGLSTTGIATRRLQPLGH